jgi:hypothetical protein
MKEGRRWKNTQGVGETARKLFLTSVVVDAIHVGIIPEGPRWPIHDLPSVHLPGFREELALSWSSGSSAVRQIAQILWTLLLFAAVVVFLRHARANKTLIALYAILIVQVGIAMQYSNETFILSLHTTPLLILSLGILCRTRYRVPVLIAVSCITIFAAVNNLPAFSQAMADLAGILQFGGS